MFYLFFNKTHFKLIVITQKSCYDYEQLAKENRLILHLNKLEFNVQNDLLFVTFHN